MAETPTLQPGLDELRELRAQQLRAELVRLARAMPAPSPATWEKPASATAAKSMKSMKPLAAVLPVAARVATGKRPRVDNPKIQRADLGAYHRESVDESAFERRVREVAKERTRGEPSEGTLREFGRELASQSRRNAKTLGSGLVQMTHAFAAGCMRRGKGTVRRCVRFYEKHGLIDTWNVLHDGRRDANAYVLLPDAPAATPADAPADAPAAEPRPVGRRTEAIARCARFFLGLVVRPWGLNRTPLTMDRRRSERRPAPA